MTAIVLFTAGVAVGVVFEKSIRSWKIRVERAAHAAADAMKEV